MDENKNKIIVGHYHGKSFWSRLIRLRSWWKSPITHTAILTPDLMTVYEAWGKGCLKHSWDNSHHVPGTVVEMMEIPCTEEQYDAVYGFLDKTQGAQYDRRGVIFGFLAQGERQDKDRYFCTEWCELALEAGKLCFQDRMPAHKMTPSLAYVSPIQIYHCTKRTP
jgi:hypothetical protein